MLKTLLHLFSFIGYHGRRMSTINTNLFKGLTITDGLIVGSYLIDIIKTQKHIKI